LSGREKENREGRPGLENAPYTSMGKTLRWKNVEGKGVEKSTR